jgi:hypothetical protein
MRPRKTSFGTMKFNDFKKFATENNVFGHTVHIEKDVLTYTFLAMFRDNKRPPEELYVDVSTVSKNVINVRSDRRQFLNIDDVIEKMKRKS